MSLLEHAKKYHKVGLSLIPVDISGGDKKPAVAWKKYQSERPTEGDLIRWFGNGSKYTTMGCVCGKVSLGLTVVDFDVPELYFKWRDLVKDHVDISPYPVQKTGRIGGGFQIFIRSDLEVRNTKLAFVHVDPSEEAPDGKMCGIETRGAGGFTVIPPSLHPSGNHYAWEPDSSRVFHRMKPEDLELVLDLARSLDEYGGDPEAQEAFEKAIRNTKPPSGVHGSAIKAFNDAHNIRDMLISQGYTVKGDMLCRPGREGHHSVWIIDNKSYHHSSNDPLHKNHLRDCFDVFCHFEHGGDVKKAVKSAADALGIMPKNFRKPADVGEPVQDQLSPELRSIIDQYGEPYYLGKEGDVTSINQAFWAGLHQAEHIQLYEPDERSFYRYDPESGLYNVVSEDVVKQEIASRLLEVSRQEALPALERKRTAVTLGHIVSQLKGISEKRNVFRGGRSCIHLANGVIVFKDTGNADLCSFSPEFYSRNQCPISWEPAAKCDRFLNELLYPAVTHDDALLLQKYAGMSLLGDNLIQRLLILDGLPARGKSTLSLIIQGLIGQTNVTELRTQYLDDRFELYRFIKKTLLVGVDVPGNFLSEKGAHVLKGLVGGDIYDAEQKGGTGSFPIRGNFCIMITSNSRLRVRLDGDTGAWRRRLLIIRFEAPPPAKKIPNLPGILIREEGPGILNWALQGLARLLADIKAYGDIQLTESQEQIVEGLMAESDSVRHFLQEKVVSADFSDLTVSEIVEAYGEYCPQRGWNPKPITIVYRELEHLMLELFSTVRANSIQRVGKNVKGFRKVGFKKG